MSDPVIDPEGNSFEREAIERWLRTHQTSPITRSRLTVDRSTIWAYVVFLRVTSLMYTESTLVLYRLATNRALREAIEEWTASNAESENGDVATAALSEATEQPSDAGTVDAGFDSATENAADRADALTVAPLPAAAAAALIKEEERLRARIVEVEDRIGELLRQPLGPDGLGQRQVRFRPTCARRNLSERRPLLAHRNAHRRRAACTHPDPARERRRQQQLESPPNPCCGAWEKRGERDERERASKPMLPCFRLSGAPRIPPSVGRIGGPAGSSRGPAVRPARPYRSALPGRGPGCMSSPRLAAVMVWAVAARAHVHACVFWWVQACVRACVPLSCSLSLSTSAH